MAGKTDSPEFYTVMLEWTGSRAVQPLLEYIAGKRTSSSGSFLQIDLSDANWDFSISDGPLACALFERLRKAFRYAKFATFVNCKVMRFDNTRKRPYVERAYRYGKAPKLPKRRAA